MGFRQIPASPSNVRTSNRHTEEPTAILPTTQICHLRNVHCLTGFSVGWLRDHVMIQTQCNSLVSTELGVACMASVMEAFGALFKCGRRNMQKGWKMITRLKQTVRTRVQYYCGLNMKVILSCYCPLVRFDYSWTAVYIVRRCTCQYDECYLVLFVNNRVS